MYNSNDELHEGGVFGTKTITHEHNLNVYKTANGAGISLRSGDALLHFDLTVDGVHHLIRLLEACV